MEELEVQIGSIVFQASDNTFCVLRAQNKELGNVSVVFKGPAPFVGENVILKGSWGTHPKFGRQFQASVCTAEKPSSSAGIENFLASGAIKGVGKATAARIVAHFGDETLEVLDTAPYRLTEVPGIGSKKVKDIVDSYVGLNDMRELMLFLEKNGISSNYAPRIQAIYGSTAVTRIENNPYCLVEDIDGIGFKTADKIALALGLEVNDMERIKAGLGYTLNQSAGQGHTCVPEEMLLKEAASILQVEPEEVSYVFHKLLQEDMVRTEEFGGTRLVYPEYLYRAEAGTANRLLHLRDKVNKLWKVDYKKIIKKWEQNEKIELAEEQVEAIRVSSEHGVFVLTGGPGTGKTTVVKGIISVLEEAGCKIALAAPTGRAARRLAESSGRPALTVHRLLEFTPNGERGMFQRNEENPLEVDAVIVDEASMLDISLTYSLLRALSIGCRLILVGDVDQLPSVGPGSVLKDIIRSKAMPVVRLENVFRQAELSPIVRNAHKINRGLEPECIDDSDFSFKEFEEEEDAAKYIVATASKIVKEKGWQNVQVLTPMHKNPCGVQNLNKLLQETLNPPYPGKTQIQVVNNTFRVGDKVMQIKNNYDKDVFNGDIGKIISINGRDLVVQYPDRVDGGIIPYAATDLDQLQLAYAMSVHKSQGSEYEIVIMALVRSHFMLLQRNLLYTGVTRAKGKVILVGNKNALKTAISNDKTRKRYSLLAERLQDTEKLQ